MMVTNNEKYILSLYKRKPNTPYEWEDKPSITFRGRPASQVERKMYRIQQGVNGGTDSTYIYVTNLPDIVKEGDKILFNGKEWTVASVGYYFDATRFINPSLMSDEYIAKKCPKGINIQ